MTHDHGDDDWDDDSDEQDSLGFLAHTDEPDADPDESALDAFGEISGDEVAPDGNADLAAFNDPVGDDADDELIPVARATNPPGTITITAHLNGSIAQVDLDAAVVRLTEPQLAEEIRVLADVAAKKATAVTHVMVVKMFVDQGMDLAQARDFVGTNMPYATPEQAEAAQRGLAARSAYSSE